MPLQLPVQEETLVPARAEVMPAPPPESQMAELLQGLEKAVLPRVLEMAALLRELERAELLQELEKAVLPRELEMRVLVVPVEPRQWVRERQAVPATECNRPELHSLA